MHGAEFLIYLFPIVLFGTFIETGTALIHGVNERLDQAFAEKNVRMPRWMRPAVALAILFVAVVLADAVGLTSLVAQGYGTITWAFLLIYVLPLLTYGLWMLARQPYCALSGVHMDKLLNTEKILSVLLLLCILLAGCDSAPVPRGATPPDVIYHNGNVITGVSSNYHAEAVAVLDGRIVGVGSNAEVLQTASEKTEIVDLGGNTMLPGLFDNHVHADAGRGLLMEWKGGLISKVPDWVREATTISELQDTLRRESASVAKNQWIVGALSREVWPNTSLPTRADLDEGTND